MRFWKKAETELEREIAHHLHYLTAEYERQGYSREEALRMASREFGGAEQVKEQCRDERRFAWFAGLRQDVVYGLRMMRRTPAVTAAAVLSLALGIGANAAIASLMDAILWRTLPVPNAKQLRLVNWEGQESNELLDGGWGSAWKDGAVEVADYFSYPTFEAMRKSVRELATIAAYLDLSRVSVTYRGRAMVADERPVGGNFFGTIQARAAAGRLIGDADDLESAAPIVVVSRRFWANSLAADPSAVGSTLMIDGNAHVIVGILDGGFYGLYPGDSAGIYAPMHLAARDENWKDWRVNPRKWGTQLIARLAPGADAGSLRAELDAVFRASWTRQPTEAAKAPRVRLDDGARGVGSLTRSVRSPLFVLGGLVALLLVIACANIANLLLARGVARRKEIAMRLSLGCSRARLLRQFLTESALIAILGGLGSLAVASATGNVLGKFIGGRYDLPIEVALNYRVLGIVGAITAAALAIFAVFPAWKGSRQLDASWLKQGSGSIGEGRRRRWTTGKALVVAQMAMSVVLVMAAVIFTRNLRAIESSDPGFDRRNLVIFGVRPGTSGYEKSRLEQFYFELEQRLGATPGVSGAGITWMRPMNIGGWRERVHLPGAAESVLVSMNGATPSYLPLYAPRLVAGRNFTWADIHSGAKVAIISEDLARKLGGVSLVGRTLRGSDVSPKDPGYEIVGIAPSFAATSMKERMFAVWVPLRKDKGEATVVVRTAQSPGAVLPAIRRTMGEIDRNLPMVETVTMEEQISKILRRERMFATLCGGFGILATLLSVVGLYGVMAYNTSRRRSEIGLRLALGALPGDVLRMVLGEGLATALIGVALGLPAVWFCAKYAEKELFKMKALEPASLAIALGILVAAAAAAIAIPAARASALQPSETLREQ